MIRLLLLLFLLGQIAGVRAEVLVIELFNAPQVAKTLKELNPNLGVSNLGNQLVLSGSEAELAEAKTLIGQIDRAPEQLRVEWRLSQQSEQQQRGLGWRENKLRAQARQQQNSQAQQGSLSIISGATVSLRLTQNYPVVLSYWDGRRWISLQVQEDGLMATPKVIGNEVEVALSASQPMENNLRHDLPATQQIETTLRGPLGVWLEVGGLSRDEASQTLSLDGAQQGQQQGQQQLQLRVTRQ